MAGGSLAGGVGPRLPCQIPGWPDPAQIAALVQPDVAVASVGAAAAGLAARLRTELNSAGSLAALSRRLRVPETTLRALLYGKAWPDLVTVHAIEAGLPAPVDSSPASSMSAPAAEPRCRACGPILRESFPREEPYDVYIVAAEVHGPPYLWNRANCRQLERLQRIPAHAWVGHPPEVHRDVEWPDPEDDAGDGGGRFPWEPEVQAAWP